MTARKKATAKRDATVHQDSAGGLEQRSEVLEDYRSRVIRTWSYIQGCVSTIGFAALFLAIVSGLGLLSIVDRTIEDRVEGQVNMAVSTQVAGRTTEMAGLAAEAALAAARAQAAATALADASRLVSDTSEVIPLPAGPWTIVVGTTDSLADARTLKSQAVDEGYFAGIYQTGVGFLVVVGRFTTRFEAEVLLSEVGAHLAVTDLYTLNLQDLCAAADMLVGGDCPPLPVESGGEEGPCHSSYPAVCIAPPPPDLDCQDLPYADFPVTGADPHGLDPDGDGIGCESG